MRHSSGSAWRYAGCFVLAAAVEMIASARGLPHVWRGGLTDPDSYMRLVRITQGLKAGHLVNVVQRDDSGAPLVIEWSRLFDAAIVMLAAPLAPFLGWSAALRWAGVATAPLAAGALGAGLAFAAAPLADAVFLWLPPLIAPLLGGIHGFEPLGVIHYHIIMVAAVAIATGWALRAGGSSTGVGSTGAGSVGAGVAMGIAGGIAIWIMPETMPWVLLGFVGLGWTWMFRPLGRAVAAAGLAFFATLAGALWLDPPHGGVLVVEIDRLSVVYVGLGAAVAATGLWLAWLDRRVLDPTRRAIGGAAGAVACFLAWLAVYPTVALGPYALLPAVQRRLFFNQMLETQPAHGMEQVAVLLGPGLFGLGVTLAGVWLMRRRRLACGIWVIATAGALLAAGLTARFIIFMVFPAAIAAGLLPVALAAVSRHFADRPQRASLARIGLVAALLVVPYAVAIGAAAADGKLHSPAKPKAASCALRHIAPLLRPAAGQVVLSGYDAVPELLYRTRIIAVGSLYQHGVAAYLRARAAWRAPATGPGPSAALLATGARFVLFCPDKSGDAIAATAPADALWPRLRAGHPPAWLQPAGAQTATGWRLYRVVTAPGLEPRAPAR